MKRRRSDGECLFEGQSQVMRIGDQAADQILREFVLTRDYEGLLEFIGTFRTIRHVSEGLLCTIKQIIFGNEYLIHERIDLIRAIADSEFPSDSAFQLAATEILNSVLSTRKLKPAHTHAERFFRNIERRKKALKWFQDGKIEIDRELLSRLLKREDLYHPQLTEDGLIQAILETVHFNFEATLSYTIMSTYDFGWYEFLKGFEPPSADQEYYLTGLGLVAVWIGDRIFSEKLKLIDLRIID